MSSMGKGGYTPSGSLSAKPMGIAPGRGLGTLNGSNGKKGGQTPSKVIKSEGPLKPAMAKKATTPKNGRGR